MTLAELISSSYKLTYCYQRKLIYTCIIGSTVKQQKEDHTGVRRRTR